MNIGVIAEEVNDVEVLYEFTCKLVEENKFSFKKFVGHGCGKLRKKCTAWAKDLMRRGCSHLVVIHDLDEFNESSLRTELTNSVHHINFDKYVILIPIKEIEAWLLTDATALKTVFNMSKLPNLPKSPELLQDPKQSLFEIVYKDVKKRYVNTIHNKNIAAEIRLSNMKNCRSFQPYTAFMRESSIG